MQTETLPLTGWRNTPFPADVIAFVDGLTPIDLSLKSFALEVRAVAGAGSALISLDTTDSTSANGVRASDAAGGELVVQIDQATMQSAWDAAYAAGLMKAGEPAPLVYDLRVSDEDGFAEVWLEGSFTINPGITL